MNQSVKVVIANIDGSWPSIFYRSLYILSLVYDIEPWSWIFIYGFGSSLIVFIVKFLITKQMRDIDMTFLNDFLYENHSESHVNISHLVCELICSSVNEDEEVVRSLMRCWKEVQGPQVGFGHLKVLFQ